MCTSSLLAGVLALSLLAACGDDTAGADGDAGSGGGSTTSATGSGGSDQVSTGAGGQAATGSGGADAGGGGGGGEGAACPVIPIVDGQATTCAAVGDLARPVEATTLCTADPSVAWPVTIHAVEVEAGSCLHMRADNTGTSGAADLFGAIVDPAGNSLLFDDESPCAISSEDHACPAEGTTMEASGTAYVMVGAWESEGCPAQGETRYLLTVSIDGVDVDLDSPVCAGDLLEIIP